MESELVDTITPPKPLIPKTKTKEYYRDYYHNKVRNVFECPLCLSTVTGNNSKILKHFSTNKCSKAQMNNLIIGFSQMSLN